MLSNLIAAATGILFWLLLARVAHLSPTEIGIGYAIVGMGATIGVVAKGGLDTALLRSVPATSREGGASLRRFAILVGCAVAIVLSLGLGLAAELFHALPDIGRLGWLLVGATAVLLIITWLQDAYFLAEGDARFNLQRNLVLSAGRIVLPLPVIGLAWYHPVATTWLLALVASALAALFLGRHVPTRSGPLLARAAFLRRSMRNGAGSALEFLPGLLLAPLVLFVDGPSRAGHFAIAWTAASLLFVLSASISRSALAEMVQRGALDTRAVIRTGVRQHLLTVAPAAVMGILFAPTILGVFGPQYAAEGATAFAILCASILFVAPSYLYLSLLRAEDRGRPLVVFPLVILATLLVLAPILESSHGLPGVAAAWMLANAPFGLFAAWKLRHEAKEVMPHQRARALDRRPHAE